MLKSRRKSRRKLKGGTIFDLSEAKSKLEELNEIIRSNKLIVDCNHSCKVKLEGLSLDYVKDMADKEIVSYRHPEKNDLLLCLNFIIGESIACLSSIELVVQDDVVEINSRTLDQIQGKKYNTLLRCVAMILVPLLSSQIKSVISIALNPISVYLLCRSFDGSITDKQYIAFKEENHIADEDIAFKTYAEFEAHFKQYLDYVKKKGVSVFSIRVECPVNKMTQLKNEESFIQFLESVKCIC
jgi:hypothetical protein